MTNEGLRDAGHRFPMDLLTMSLSHHERRESVLARVVAREGIVLYEAAVGPAREPHAGLGLESWL